MTRFPGGVSLSQLDVYDDAAPDGVCGGSPHMHLVATEAYVVASGAGSLQTIDADGFRETPLEAGAVVWFGPGTIHRAVNHRDLRVTVLMGDAGLPEAGDAVMTFPAEIVADAGAYAAAASLDVAGLTVAQAAARRRDLAVDGFTALRDAVERGDHQPLREFHRAAGALVRERARSWADLVRRTALAAAERSVSHAEAIAAGSLAHLADARVHEAVPSAGERRFGMCGRLRTYDLHAPGGRRGAPTSEENDR